LHNTYMMDRRAFRRNQLCNARATARRRDVA
jgi:hypothetical protein